MDPHQHILMLLFIMRVHSLLSIYDTPIGHFDLYTSQFAQFFPPISHYLQHISAKFGVSKVFDAWHIFGTWDLSKKKVGNPF